MAGPDRARRRFAAGALWTGLLRALPTGLPGKFSTALPGTLAALLAGGFAKRTAAATTRAGTDARADAHGDAPPLAPTDAAAVGLTGGRFVYEVVPGDHLTGIGARFGVAVPVLARENGLPVTARLRPGQTLRIDNRHLAPAGLDEGILINIPQRMLFHFSGGRLRAGWPVALGRPSWPTPTGAFRVATLQRDKPWIVPPSIQEEMRLEGKPVLTRVEPGPDNPLGRHWIGLSLPGYGIHGTNAPSSIYGFRSHGCIRLHPDDVADLFDHVEIGTPGRFVYETVLFGRAPDGTILVEISPDPYRRSPASVERVRALAEREGLSDRVDWGKVRDAVRAQDGIAREVGPTASAPGRANDAGPGAPTNAGGPSRASP